MQEEDRKRLKILLIHKFQKINYNMQFKKNHHRLKLPRIHFFKIGKVNNKVDKIY
jgi:hypothetical protein